MRGPLSPRLAAIAAAIPEVSWGMAIRSAGSGELLGEHRSAVVLSTASVGKVLLLVEAERLLDAGELAAEELLDRRSVPPVADSGLWQHLAVDVLAVQDVCALVGAVSDNLAANVLLRRVGLPAVHRIAETLGLRATALHDEVRDVRGPGDAERLSSATAAELTTLVAALPRRVRGWLALGVDHSMAAGAYVLDPLARPGPDRGVQLVHKTGTDIGVRADTGLVVGERDAVAYAVVANWAGDDRRDEVHAGMRRFGEVLRELVPPA